MPSFLPYGRQSLDEADIQSVVEVLRSDYLTCGPKVAEFEEAFAETVGARHAVAMSSGTAALHVALLVARIGPGDRVVTSPNTFLASANCAAYVGATPDFADIDPVSYNLDPAALEAGWQPDTRAVVAVDYAGQVANLPEISRIARARGAIVIEDACHGVGGAFRYGGRIWRQGGNPWADIAVFSFHPVKTMTTGEGGMLVTDKDEYARRARLLRNHGMERDTSRLQLFGTAGDLLGEVGPWAYEMQELGFNYRITDVQCALGLSQLRRLPAFITRRREIVAHYNSAFADLPWLVTPDVREPASADLASWHLYTVQIDFPQIGRSRAQVMADLRQQGIGTQVLYIPVYLQPFYRRSYGYRPGKCPAAEAYYQHTLSLPLYPAMTDADVERVVQVVLDMAAA